MKMLYVSLLRALSVSYLRIMARVVCVVETTDHQHVEKLLRVICQAGIKVI